MRLEWVTTTPLGAAVEPEVYCNNAGSPLATDGDRQCSASSELTSSVANQPHPANSCTASLWRRKRSKMPLSPSTTDTSASAAMACSLGNVLREVGGKVGTGTRPAQTAPRNASNWSRPGGKSSRALSPGRVICCRRAATLWALWHSSPKVRLRASPSPSLKNVKARLWAEPAARRSNKSIRVAGSGNGEGDAGCTGNIRKTPQEKAMGTSYTEMHDNMK